MTPSTFIFDTNVLSAFAIAGQLSQLEVRYRHRAHWVDVVHSEIARGVSTEPALGDVLAATWLAPPIETFALADIERVRQRLGGRSATLGRRRPRTASLAAVTLRRLTPVARLCVRVVRAGT